MREGEVVAMIGVRNLRIDCIVGIRERERQSEQPLFVDVALEVDISAAARSGDLEDTVDYSQVASLLTELARTRRFRLIEAFAQEATEVLLERFRAATTVRLEVRKPGAVSAADHAFLRIERRRERI